MLWDHIFYAVCHWSKCRYDYIDYTDPYFPHVSTIPYIQEVFLDLLTQLKTSLFVFSKFFNDITNTNILL